MERGSSNRERGKIKRESVGDNIDSISRQKLPEFAEKPSAS
jgi:hypothetical protein